MVFKIEDWPHKIYHLIGGLIFPIFYYFIPSKKLVLIVFFVIAVIFLIIEVLRFFSSSAQKVLYKSFGKLKILFKKEEGFRVSGTTYFGWGSFLTALLFPKEIAILALIFVVLGDLMAAIFGPWGKIKFLNRNLEGLLAAFIVSLGAGLLFNILFGFNFSLKIIIGGALAGAFIGHISDSFLKINDNLTIPLISALVMRIL